MKVRDVITMIEQDGWDQIAHQGSHRQFKHRSKPGKVTIAGLLSANMDMRTYNSILKQADLK
jgi:predicted RNA binding protein YcfA (HicA-like mRNA interferase family)